MAAAVYLWLLPILCWNLCRTSHGTKYYGKLLGDFKTSAHGVKGQVFAVDKNTFFIKNFEYDGEGPDAFFWGDVEEQPTSAGFVIPTEEGKETVLPKYNGKDLVVKMPNGMTIKDIKSLSVWCRRFSVKFGSLRIMEDDLPDEKSLGPLPTFAHDVKSSDVVIKDAKTIFISQLHYDGQCPDAFFLVGNGSKPHHTKASKVPDEHNSLKKLKGYHGKNVTLRLPGDMTVFDIEWFGLYCIAFQENFGHVMVPKGLNVPANIDDLLKDVEFTQGRSAISNGHGRMADQKYYGKMLGRLKTNAHDVVGTVYAASDDTFYVENFSYDGQGPDAYFWVGTTEMPSPNGFIVPDEFGTKQVLKKYTNQNIAITLPEGTKMADIKWLSVWCRKFAVNFGHVMIPKDFDPPKELNLGPLPSFAHDARAKSVIVKDAHTIQLIGLEYDGFGPDAFFYVGTGDAPHNNGMKVPDENGSLDKLKAYGGKDVTVRLPNDMTVFDIDWFSIYCITFKHNFAHVMIPKDINVPADLKSLKAMEMKFENCEELFPGVFQVRWRVVGQDLYVKLTGIAGNNDYLSFGRSGHDDRAAMIGADVVVAYFDAKSNEAKVIDYYLSAKSQCSHGSGACPDERLKGNNNVQVLSWERTDGKFSVIYKRPLAAGDGEDLSIPMSIPVSVVAAIGPLNSQGEASYHPQYTKGSLKIHFGRIPAVNRCSFINSGDVHKSKGWPPLRIVGETTFRAQIGPTGGDKGYTAITGIQSWGNSWWINGLLIPEIYVQRGINYTFIVEGGDDSTNPAEYHPFYITNNAEGGGGQFLEQLGSEKHKIYAGVMTDGQRLIPVGVGRMCKWKKKSVESDLTEAETFEQYAAMLKLDCVNGEPGRFTWMPDEDTPDNLYYQCFTHRNLGWKIHVVNDQHEGVFLGHMSGSATHLSSAPIFVAIFICLSELVLRVRRVF